MCVRGAFDTHVHIVAVQTLLQCILSSHTYVYVHVDQYYTCMHMYMYIQNVKVPVYCYILINRFQNFAIETLCIKTLKFSTSNNSLLGPLDRLFLDF